MDRFEAGTKTDFGEFSVLELHGTWRDMGRQYGALASDEMRGMYRSIYTENLLLKTDKDKLEAVAERFFANYPFRLKEILRGMSETSGLDLADHILINACEVVVSSELSQAHQHCSGVGVWGDYSMGPLVYGRNYDYLPWFRDLGKYITVAAYHPCDGSVPSATITYSGCVYLTTGINARGIFVELNNAEPSGGALWYDSRVPTIAELMCFLFDSSSLDELESQFQSTRSNFAYLVAAADDQAARCYEWPVFDIKRRISLRRPGLMVATNHFTEPTWGLPRPEDEIFWHTRSRRQNLLNLAEHFKGSIDAARMKKLLDTRLEDLGATTDFTVYQVVAEPGKLSLSLKVPEMQDWTEIPIGDFLKG